MHFGSEEIKRQLNTNTGFGWAYAHGNFTATIPTARADKLAQDCVDNGVKLSCRPHESHEGHSILALDRDAAELFLAQSRRDRPSVAGHSLP